MSMSVSLGVDSVEVDLDLDDNHWPWTLRFRDDHYCTDSVYLSEAMMDALLTKVAAARAELQAAASRRKQVAGGGGK